MTLPGSESWEPGLADPDEIPRLRDLLVRIDFREKTIAGSLGVDWRDVSGQDAALLLRRTREETPLNTLVRLFLVGVEVAEEPLRRAIRPIDPDEWMRHGLVCRRAGGIAARVRLIPHDGLWVAFDPPARPDEGFRPDYVMGIGSSSLTLAAATIRRHSRRTLDLGCGCGFQAFLAARHSDRVLATDLNPRAVRIADFNARLNGFSNVECREGDLLAPVAGELFDLAVANPPFIVSPESRYIYRDGAHPGDNVSRRIIRGISAVLADGGFCQILCNWPNQRGSDWRERLAAWFEGKGCDAWVMRTETLEADAYAVRWIRHTEWDDPAAFSARLERWLEFYAREGIESVSGGVITMRRRTRGAPWLRCDDGPGAMLHNAGESFARAFELRDFLEEMRDDEALLARRLKTSPDARLRQQLAPAPGAWGLETSELVMAQGLGFRGDADVYLMRFLARCDGTRALREVIASSADDLGEPWSRAAPAWLGIARRLVEMGFLLPA